jgi:hypothetical protein
MPDVIEILLNDCNNMLFVSGNKFPIATKILLSKYTKTIQATQKSEASNTMFFHNWRL